MPNRPMPNPPAPRPPRRAALALVLLLLAGCAGSPTRSPPPTVDGVAAPLAAERRWLDGWFKGTPVLIGPGPGASLRVEVPPKYCFDPASTVVKPPLGAVLDKVSQSLARQPHARLELAASTPERIDSVRDRLVERGVAAHRIDRLGPREGVELHLVAPPRAIERLEDPPRQGTRPP